MKKGQKTIRLTLDREEILAVLGALNHRFGDWKKYGRATSHLKMVEKPSWKRLLRVRSDVFDRIMETIK